MQPQITLTYAAAIRKARELSVARQYTLRRKNNKRGFYLFMRGINSQALSAFYIWVGTVVGDKRTTSVNKANDTATLTLYYQESFTPAQLEEEQRSWRQGAI